MVAGSARSLRPSFGVPTALWELRADQRPTTLQGRGSPQCTARGHQMRHTLGSPPPRRPPQRPGARINQWVQGEEEQGTLWDPIPPPLACPTTAQLAPRAPPRGGPLTRTCPH